MASNSIPVLFLLSVMLLANETTAEKNHSIPLGSSLSPNGTSWPSSSGLFAFGFYPERNGFAVGIWLGNETENTVVWTAKHDRPPLSSNSTLELTRHGRLILREGDEIEELISADLDSATSASMLDSGNFVLYNNNSGVIWQSFDLATDTILGGQNLTSGKNLVSSMSKSDHSSGHFFLIMQEDNYLVAYPVNSSLNSEDAYWANSTNYPSGSVHLSLDVEGSLCLNGYGTQFQCLIKSTELRNESQSTTSIYRATLDEDGNFRLYKHQFEGDGSSRVQILWSALPDECKIRGFCGLNSYCKNISGNAVCDCYPGFMPSKNSRKSMFLECRQNRSKYDCESIEDPKMLYNITSLKGMWWGDYAYSAVPVEIETCKKSCQEDCDCGAVLYRSGICSKYKLPLRYGRMDPNESGVAFFKVPSGNVISPNNPVLLPMKPMVLSDNKRSLIMILAFTLGFISLLCLVFAISTFFTYRRQVYRYTMLSATANLGFTEECSLRSFSFDELVKSTGGFTEEVGRGSFGAVYRGTICGSNRRIAVMRLERIVDEGEREFRAEITAIARTHHRNLVQLVGFCIDGSRRLLVYEYISNGSLADLLFETKRHLSWKERVKIALDVARGVLYLHEECEVRIIHRNIKPQNILMDEAWTAKISDFGLARLLKPDQSRTKAGDDGTSRYLPPELQKDASVSVKADIYSYGVILLEIVCRRSSIDVNVSSAEEILLSSWVYQCFVAGQLNKLVADDGEDVDWKLMERMVKVGLWCVQDDPSLRPSMKNVILMFEGLKDIPIPPCPANMVK